MSYDRATLAACVKQDIGTNPRVTLRSICLQYQVDRHTINRALRECLGVSFATIKNRIRDERIRAALGDAPATHIKQAALSAVSHIVTVPVTQRASVVKVIVYDGATDSIGATTTKVK